MGFRMREDLSGQKHFLKPGQTYIPDFIGSDDKFLVDRKGCFASCGNKFLNGRRF